MLLHRKGNAREVLHRSCRKAVLRGGNDSGVQLQADGPGKADALPRHSQLEPSKLGKGQDDR